MNNSSNGVQTVVNSVCVETKAFYSKSIRLCRAQTDLLMYDYVCVTVNKSCQFVQLLPADH